MDEPAAPAPTAYDDDVYAWAHEQAALLRDLARTRRDLPNALDIENLCEEIEGVARTDLREARSFLRLLLLHLLKLASASSAPAIRHWRAEVIAFQSDYAVQTTRTILRKIDTGRIWSQAVRQAEAALASEGDGILPNLPRSCPFTAAELAEEDFDLDAALARLRAAAASQTPQPAA